MNDRPGRGVAGVLRYSTIPALIVFPFAPTSSTVGAHGSAGHESAGIKRRAGRESDSFSDSRGLWQRHPLTSQALMLRAKG